MFITPLEISPLPLIEQYTRARRKRSVPTVLTASPYKSTLEESIKNIEARKQRPIRSKVKKCEQKS